MGGYSCSSSSSGVVQPGLVVVVALAEPDDWSDGESGDSDSVWALGPAVGPVFRCGCSGMG